MIELYTLEYNDRFVFECNNYEVAMGWEGELPEIIECFDFSLNDYVTFNPYTMVLPVKK